MCGGELYFYNFVARVCSAPVISYCQICKFLKAINPHGLAKISLTGFKGLIGSRDFCAQMFIDF